MKTIIFWFRQDLRLSDNPGLFYAASQGHVLPVYILDSSLPPSRQMGQASLWWVTQSLEKLDQSLDGRLHVLEGCPKDILTNLLQEHNANEIVWNRCYEPWRIERDSALKQYFAKKGVVCKSFNSALLWEPWESQKDDETPYKVFTPFLNALRKKMPLLRACVPSLPRLSLAGLQPCRKVLAKPRPWHEKLATHWQVGEQAALAKLSNFLNHGLTGYEVGRNFPAQDHTSGLSPHLHFGEISPVQIVHALRSMGDIKNPQDAERFFAELAWREFAYSLAYHFPFLGEKCLQQKFERFGWENNQDIARVWQNGNTGYPIIDAGMRELWQTGAMHGRVRMLVGSFLVKNLLQHWHIGRDWFWDCLVDADFAVNSTNWQWVAGCGVDAAPYFRIFNPVTQAEKFDPEGSYIRKFLPELAHLPNRFLFRPWETPLPMQQEILKKNKNQYPFVPVVDLETSRNKALSALKLL